MRFSLKDIRRRETVPAQVSARVDTAPGESVLNGVADLDGTAWLVATNHRLAMVPSDGAAGWQRPWHEVDHASWDRESGLLTVTWVHGGRPDQWRLGDERTFLQTLRERVQASVVLAEDLRLTGRRTGRAVIRQDLASGELLDQVILGRGVREDEEVEAAAGEALSWLREQVGLPSSGGSRTDEPEPPRE